MDQQVDGAIWLHWLAAVLMAVLTLPHVFITVLLQWGPSTIALSPGGATVKGTRSLDRPTGFTLWKRRRESSVFILIQWKCRSVVCLDVLKWEQITRILPGDEVFFSSRHAHVPSSQLLSQLGNGPWLILIRTNQIRSSWRNGQRQ